MIDNRKKYVSRRTAVKLYLSEEARQMLVGESVRTTYPMSVIVDQLIKAHIDPEARGDVDHGTN